MPDHPDRMCGVRTMFVPAGQALARYVDRIWSWDHIFEPLPNFFLNPDAHQFTTLEPKEDFFDKPLSQINTDA